MVGLILKQNVATLSQIQELLSESDQDFVPRLSSQVEIHTYARKLIEKATRIEGWRNQSLAGFVAFYILRNLRKGFVSSVCIHPAQRGGGIAKILLENAEGIMALEGVRSVELEVGASNVAATALYESAGYERTSVAGALIRMKKPLGNKQDTEHE